MVSATTKLATAIPETQPKVVSEVGKVQIVKLQCAQATAQTTAIVTILTVSARKAGLVPTATPPSPSGTAKAVNMGTVMKANVCVMTALLVHTVKLWMCPKSLQALAMAASTSATVVATAVKACVYVSASTTVIHVSCNVALTIAVSMVIATVMAPAPVSRAGWALPVMGSGVFPSTAMGKVLANHSMVLLKCGATVMRASLVLAARMSCATKNVRTRAPASMTNAFVRLDGKANIVKSASVPTPAAETVNVSWTPSC